MQSRSPDATPGEDPAQAWWSFDPSSSALGLPMTAFSTAHRDRCVASDVLCRSHPGPAFRWTPDTPPGPSFAAASSKATESKRTRTPSLDECCLLRFGLRRAHRRAWLAPGSTEGHEITGNLAPGVMSPPRGRLPALFHHPSTRLDGQAQGDSWASLRLAWNRNLDRTPLVEFCNQNNP